ncbi:MAG: Sec-independent protein translocase protein TatB [Acidobacteriota bacterium]
MFGPIGMPELIIIFIIALIVFGPRKLPDLGKSLGKSLAEFRRASNDLRNTLEEEIQVEETRKDLEETRKELTSPLAEPDRQPTGKAGKTHTPDDKEASPTAKGPTADPSQSS